MNRETPKLWGKGHFKINDFATVAYILTDGTPLLSKNKMFEAIGMKRKGSSRSESPGFIGAINLQQYIRPELQEQLKGVEFYDGARLVSAYPAEILVSVCNVYLEARQAGDLTPSQEPIAQGCEILVRSFAKVGITALIYEQLGFEKYKHPEAFRILIEGYLSEEERKWSKEFPDELFIQMDRIYGNIKTTSRNRPQYYAKFIRKYIYKPLENGEVLARLDQINPVIKEKGQKKGQKKGKRKARHHSHTSLEIGLPAIKSQIWQVVGALKISANKRIYENNFAKMMGKSYQIGMFDDDDDK